MATDPKRLINGSQLTTSVATYYTAPTATKTRIATCSSTNDSGGAVTVTVYLVPTGGSASASNMVCKAMALAAGETKTIAGAIGQVLEAGGSIQALASAGASVNIVASGYEIV